jgi:23S rRNA pseudouridine1911/1915/1917 synthase
VKPRTGAPAPTVRLDLALIRLRPELSRRRAREVIEKGQVTVGGETRLEPGAKVAEGAAIEWDPNRKALPRARCSLEVLYRDASLVIVDKPAGLLSVPSSPDAAGEDTALARVADYARHLPGRRSWAAAVHRLDRDTSGALAFALDPTLRPALRALFREHRVERRYAVLVQGRPPRDDGVIDAPIGDEYRGGRRHVAREGEPSRPARTRFRVVARFPGAAHLDVELETGRQHQIRVHLAHAGMPVLGDAVYGPPAGSRLPVEAPRQMLHAHRLAFTHPVTGAGVRVDSPLPADFRRTLSALRRLAPRSGRRPRP